MFNIILAIDQEYGISCQQQIPWHLKSDLQYFKKITTQGSTIQGGTTQGGTTNDIPNVILMGRLTADTLISPLVNRINYVLTSQENYRNNQGFYIGNSFVKCLIDILEQQKKGKWGELFVIGGKQLIKEALNFSNLIKTIYLTNIVHDYHCDQDVKELEQFLTKCHSIFVDSKFEKDNKNGQTVKLIFKQFIPNKITSSEANYLNILEQLIRSPCRSTRNGITMSQFGTNLTFDLKHGFPALTTKRLFWKGVVNELLFFLAGCTDNHWLQARGVHIWDGNTNSDFLTKVGLPYQEGDLGPMYGYQFRYFGQPYINKNQRPLLDNSRDQLSEVIKLIQNDPYSRRILLTTYNYSQSKEGVLYPCHGIVIQFYVQDDMSIDCQMYQRSADWFLGVPFNIASYALLLHIIVDHLNYLNKKKIYSVGRLLMTFGDYHLYANHIEASLTQIGRIPKTFPTLEILTPVKSIDPEYLLQLSSDNFKLVDYNPYPLIKAEMIA